MKAARPKRTRLRNGGRGKGPALSADAIAAIESAIGYRFVDKTLLERAMTHASAADGRDPSLSNQRLEFLGDRVLGLVIAQRLFERRRNEQEGSLAPRLNRLVNKRACADAVQHLGIGGFVLMSPHEIAQGGREREGTLGDLCEAVIAAVYLDGGLGKARAVIEKAFAPQFKEQHARVKDPKTLLQEWAQGQGMDLPRYRTLSREGPDHAPRFVVEVEVGSDLVETGEDRSKQDAERAAALKLLNRVDPLDDD